jgi:hypothetical protein
VGVTPSDQVASPDEVGCNVSGVTGNSQNEHPETATAVDVFSAVTCVDWVKFGAGLGTSKGIATSLGELSILGTESCDT